MMKNRFFILLLTATICFSAKSKVVLPSMFSDGMVMQQMQTRLWGTAAAGRTVTVIPSWSVAAYKTKADTQGKWSLEIKTPSASYKQYSISLDDGQKTILKNILIGEVWICSGQSNMEMPMKGFKNQPVGNAVVDILHSGDTSLRLFTVKRNSQFQPVDTVCGSWMEADPASVREFSATAYYFGRELRRILNVPVGLIVTSWGGSACEAWMTSEWLKAFPDAKVPSSPQDVKSPNRTPTVLYNGMLHPLIGMSMRGVIWYQGEDNVPRYRTYADMMSVMVKGWRSQWGQGDFPFYYCQIAPYDYSIIGWKVNSAFLREQQAKAELIIPNCGMAVLTDAGLEYGIHPRKKEIAGQRLALLALDKTYKISGLTSQSAYFDKAEFRHDTTVVSFKRADMWIYGRDGYKSSLFEVAGADSVFHPAKAWVERNKVYVKSDEVVHPVAVRYAFHNWTDGDLFCDGLPLSSFRSDNW